MRNGERRRVVVTGLGMITPLGNDVDSTWRELVAGRSGIGRITTFDPSALETKIAGEVKGFDPLRYMDRKEARRTDRFAQFAIAVAKQAMDDAGYTLDRAAPEAGAAGVMWSSGVGGIQTIVENVHVLADKGHQRISPFMVPMMIIDMGAGAIAMQFGFKGPNLAVVSACASSANAVGGALFLEELEHAKARGARIYAELVGYGLTADAYHITAPAEHGEGAVRAMRMALDDAGLAPEEVDYINAHGTSTPANDGIETEAIKTVFGTHARELAVSSTKSMIGHTLGAAGAIEAAICVLAMRDGCMPPTINQEVPDPACDLDYVPNAARRRDVRVALSNSMGFGGHNAVLVLRRLD